MQNIDGDIQMKEQILTVKNSEIKNYDTKKIHPVRSSIEGSIEKQLELEGGETAKKLLEIEFDNANINHSFDQPEEDVVRNFPEIQTKI